MHPQHEFARRERLGDVVIGAQLESGDPVGLLTERRQHDDRCAVGLESQTPADLQPVEAGQHDVEDHEVGAAARVLVERGDPVGGQRYPVSGAFQIAPHHVADRRIVVDDQHSCPHGTRLLPGSLRRSYGSAHVAQAALRV
jgi:hypothetical protein